MNAFIFMTGTTGAGKTTHGKILAQKIGALYISSGDIARRFMDEETAASFKDGGLSPHENRIRAEIANLIDPVERVAVFDGFPRIEDQMRWLSKTFPAALFKVELEWSSELLVSRWMSRSRDEFDTLKAFILRDEIYRRDTKPLFSTMPGLSISSNVDRGIIDMNNQIRGRVSAWLRDVAPWFGNRDSPKQRLIDKFMADHNITLWEPLRRGTTYAMEPGEIERKLWEIANA